MELPVQPLLYERIRLISSGSRGGPGTRVAVGPDPDPDPEPAQPGAGRTKLRRTLYRRTLCADLYETRTCAAESAGQIVPRSRDLECVQAGLAAVAGGRGSAKEPEPGRWRPG